MTHGPSCDIRPEYCTPLELGAAVRTDFLYDLHDDMGNDHISQKDKLYCELTGLYWLWKNDTHEITGLTHYRRQFPIKLNHIENVLKTHEIILPFKVRMPADLKTQYLLTQPEDDWKIMCDVLKDMYPDYYKSAIKIFHRKCLIPYNMFISTHEIIDKYCEWLFPLLFKIEEKLDFTDRTEYQKRACGFMGELFLTLYVIHNDLKIKHIPISFMSENRCDNTTIINLLSSANCLTYKKWKKETKSLATERITGNRDDSTMKKIAINTYNRSDKIFYILGKLYCRYYSY